MILGIDVGGTHTDAVLIEDLKLKKKTKVLTDANNLIGSLLNATNELLQYEDIKSLHRVVFSTTISTNAIVQNKLDRVGLILSSGPGLHHSYLKINDDSHFISGYINNRGIEISEIDVTEVTRLREILKNEGINYVGVIGKFSTRNPSHELQVKEIIDYHFKHVSLGHRMSGHLNFPRRISTTYLNAAIWNTYNHFVTQVVNFFKSWKLDVPIYILKADGGTIDIAHSAEFPVQTILSGPASSVMGIMSMFNRMEDAVALDIGGTTTDIAVFADGSPVLESYGVNINGYKTLIRGMRTTSIGLGGDSKISLENDSLKIGPERAGPAAAFGGRHPTPTDAMIVLGLAKIGNFDLAKEAITKIAKIIGKSVTHTAQEILDIMCRQIVYHINKMISEINNKPVYTIHEMLEEKKISPKAVYVVGGPAHAISKMIGKLMNCPSYVPKHAEAANAIGAALARTTAEITIHADTERRELSIGEDGVQMVIPSNFTKEDAIRIGTERLRDKAVELGAIDEYLETEVIEDMEFNMVRSYYTVGRNIRVRMQVKPGLIEGYKRGSIVC